MSSEPLFNFDPVKYLKRLFGLEEPTPQEQAAETQVAEAPATPQQISLVTTPPEEQLQTTIETIQPLPNPEPLPTVQEAPPEAPLQPTPPPSSTPPNVNPPQPEPRPVPEPTTPQRYRTISENP